MGVQLQLQNQSDEAQAFEYDPAVDRITVYELMGMPPEKRRIILERQVEYVLQDEYEVFEANEVFDYPESDES